MELEALNFGGRFKMSQKCEKEKSPSDTFTIKEGRVGEGGVSVVASLTERVGI